MTITLDLHIEAMLHEKALRDGQEPEAIAKMLLASALKADAWDYQQFVAAIREAPEAGPGKPIEQYVAEQRVKHGRPDTWPSAKLTETEAGVVVDES